MVAIKAHQAAAFMKAPPPQLSAALFFGSDAGLVSERSAALAATLADRETPRGEIMRLDDTELEADPARLEVELQMRPMFSSRRIVRAIAGRRVTAQHIEPLLTSGPLEGLLIVEAGNLKTDDRLRRLFETSSGCFAVACYPDSAEDIEDLIDEVLSPYRIAIEADARGLLQSRLGADRALSRAEVEKLALFCLGRPAITLEDVENIVGDASDLVLERIAIAAADGQTQAALNDFGRALASGENAQTVILITQRYFMKLHKVRAGVDAGQRLDDALKAMRPPLFFKQRDAFGRQVRRWPRAQLDQALKRIAETAKAARLTSALADVLTERLILSLSLMASASTTVTMRR
jgi:DNA polymerase-3 subunit delta